MKTRALIAEFIGTFALLFVIFNVLHNFELSKQLQLLAVALGVGTTIAVIGTALGPISGGHFNPAVTFGMMVARRMDFGTGILYWLAQCAGAVAAVFAAAWMAGEGGEAIRIRMSVSRGSTVSLAGAIVAEMIATYLFLTVIFMTTDHRSAPKNGALYLGATLTIGILAIGTISGGAINPAVGFAFSVGSSKWDNLASWLAGPLLGAGLAALMYIGMWNKDEDVPAPTN